MRVARRERQILLLGDVLGGNEPDQFPGQVDQRQLLDFPVDHHPFGFVERDLAGVNDQLLDRRHAIDNPALTAHESHVARRQQSLQLP